MIRAFSRAAARKFLAFDSVWGAIPKWLQLDYLRVQRNTALQDRFGRRCAKYLSDSTVLSGPFIGLRYPVQLAHGSALLPKLIGSYESELHHQFQRLVQQKYQSVVDIGFAEGYYLIGLGRVYPSATLWGFDISHEAHSLCRELAEANGITSARLHLYDRADPETLRGCMKGRTLLISDCEGFEMDLFRAENEDLWKRADLIIECHDFIRTGATSFIYATLQRTHEVQVISTVDPAQKLYLVGAELRREFSEAELLRLVSEGRPCAQTWLVATPLDDADSSAKQEPIQPNT